MQVILLERIDKLGQMGEVVNVKPGYARNFLLPQKKALRATPDSLAIFEKQRGTLEAANEAKRGEAEASVETLEGTSLVLIRSAGETGQLYGSVTARDVAVGLAEAGFAVERRQVELANPIKTLGLHVALVRLHPEVVVEIELNVAQSVDEAKMQAERGEAVTEASRAEDERAAEAGQAAEAGVAEETAEEFFKAPAEADAGQDAEADAEADKKDGEADAD